jgi:hypothetical protein
MKKDEIVVSLNVRTKPATVKMYAFSWGGNPAVLAAEIEDELSKVDRIVNEISETFSGMPKTQKKRRIYEESLALKLQNFYTGCERIFDNIASVIDKRTPSYSDEGSARWHIRLLESMALDIKNVRPQIISQETLTDLKEFLSFRHRSVKIYGFELQSEPIENLVGKVVKTHKRFRKDVLEFTGFLKEMGKPQK